MYTYCAHRKQSRKGVKRGTLEMAANCFTTDLIEKEMS